MTYVSFVERTMTKREVMNFKRVLNGAGRAYAREVLRKLRVPSDVIQQTVPDAPEEACPHCGHRAAKPLNLDLLDSHLEKVELAGADAARFAA
jgi:hypothetical protein